MRILLGMSGGLDSSYAALKLIEEGHSVEGAVLIMHEYTDVLAARRAASELNIKLHEIDCRELFYEKVIPNFADQYKKGRTPNPCIVCNREVKFKALFDYAMANGFDKIATGHYAKIGKYTTENGEKCKLMRSFDSKKDQTYMLWRLPSEIISSLVLPLGDLSKNAVRKAAGASGISAAESRESQEICFIPDGDHGRYIEDNFGAVSEGDFVDENGKVLGRHKGIIHYTIGQRKGLGIALGQRAFITDIDPVTDKITVSLSAKETESFTVSDIIYSGIEPRSCGEIGEYQVKVRYQAPPVPATVIFGENSTAKVILETPARSVTAGQSAVFYDGDTMLFGGFID